MIIYKNNFLTYSTLFFLYQLKLNKQLRNLLIFCFTKPFYTAHNKVNNKNTKIKYKSFKPFKNFFLIKKSFKNFFFKDKNKKDLLIIKAAKPLKNHFNFLSKLYFNFFFLTGSIFPPYRWDLENKTYKKKKREGFIVFKKSKKSVPTLALFRFNFLKKNKKLSFKDYKYFIKSVNKKIKSNSRMDKYPYKPYSIFKKYKFTVTKDNCIFLRINFFYKKSSKAFKLNNFFFRKYKTKRTLLQNFLKIKVTSFFNANFTYVSKKNLVRSGSSLFLISLPKLLLKKLSKFNKPKRFKFPFYKQKLKKIIALSFKKYRVFKRNVTCFTSLIQTIVNKNIFFKNWITKNTQQLVVTEVFFKNQTPFTRSNTEPKALFLNLSKAEYFYKPQTLFPYLSFFNLGDPRLLDYSIKVRTPRSFNFFNIRNLPYFNSKNLSRFILSASGFLFLTKNFSLKSKYKLLKSRLKKKYNSFFVRNDLQKFIIKKYVREPLVFAFLNKYSINNKQTPMNNILKNLEHSGYLKTLNVKNNDPYKQNPYMLKSISSSKINPIFIKPAKEASFFKNSDIRIRKIRFKPGYMTFWRESRSVLKNILNLNFRYQYRLTRYLTKFNKLIKANLFLSNEMRLKNLIIRARMFVDPLTTTHYINCGLFYINGISCVNYNFQLHKGDFVQMVIHIKYYITNKWFMHAIGKKKLKLKLRTRKKNIISFSDEEKIRTKTYPKWILSYRYFREDTPPFFELDFLTLSFFIIYEPSYFSDIRVDSLIWDRYSIINMYNWKYIN